MPGRVAVVTGASGRLGSVWTSALLDGGAGVLAIDLMEQPSPSLKEVVALHPADRFHFVQADVTERGSLLEAWDACLNHFDVPDVLVNNAGIDQPPSATAVSWPFGDIPAELSQSVLDVNALGALLMCQVFGPAMAERGRGSVINIGSLYGGLAPDPRLYEHLPADPPFLKPPAYAMSKAGVGALTRYLAALWGPAGVRVNTLVPGGVLADQDAEFRAKFTARVPLRRMAEAEDLTGPFLFLASDLSRYVTGTEVIADGGYGCW
ncbi:SDR family oxidoreductase [Micromonospora sp. NPDC051227]|uniref:SDR family oxidoreductase n=1 Tax=Micromonospora sp. NPDC051227 TaxID=3364285 RepID=UPI0037B22C6B